MDFSRCSNDFTIYELHKYEFWMLYFYRDDIISMKTIRLSRHLFVVHNALCIGIRWTLWLWNTAADTANATAATTIHIHVFVVRAIIARIEINGWRCSISDPIIVYAELWRCRNQIWAFSSRIQWTFPIAARTTPAIIMFIVYVLMVCVFIVDDLKL